MDYNGALEYLHGLQRFGSKLGLERIQRLMELLGHPERAFPSIHIAGTNGKGSVTAMTARCLESAGYKVGMYISPFIDDFTERISINGENVPREKVAELTHELKSAVEKMVAEGSDHPTEFEVVTAMGFKYFAEEMVDIACVEVGLGGRYDATNVVRPLVSVITTVGYDHMDRLGGTLDLIAGEKAGIIKEGVPSVTAPQRTEALEVIRRTAEKKRSELTIVGCDVRWSEVKCSVDGQAVDMDGLLRRYETLEIGLLGRHQQTNAATAVAALEILDKQGMSVPEEAIRSGLREVRWPGRLEVMGRRPLVVVDGAHNVDGARVLAGAISEILPHRKMVLVIGILADKSVADILAELVPLAERVVVTRPNSPRALAPSVLAERVTALGKDAVVRESVTEAVIEGFSLAEPDDLLCVTGSLYLIGEARRAISSHLKGFSRSRGI